MADNRLNMNKDTLNIAEIPYEDGTIQFRYARVMSEDGTKWIRHGLFQSFYENGKLASEGEYDSGLETGIWKSFHGNGQLAALGEYREGKEVGSWQYWDESGQLENTEYFS